MSLSCPDWCTRTQLQDPHSDDRRSVLHRGRVDSVPYDVWSETRSIEISVARNDEDAEVGPVFVELTADQTGYELTADQACRLGNALIRAADRAIKLAR